MFILKMTQIGNSLGAIFPKELVNQLGVNKGETVFVTKAPNGNFNLTPYDPTLEEQLNAGREFMHEYRDTFRQLAK